MSTPDPRSLKHRPVVLLPYEASDGPYAGQTDCKFLSVGWAQYDPLSLSVKTMRHTGEGDDGRPGRWSRQSEELPLHRAVDATLLIAETLSAIAARDSVTLPPGTLENQPITVVVPFEFDNERERGIFESNLQDQILLRRLSKLADGLERLRKRGLI
jgi:hypothetical protein